MNLKCPFVPEVRFWNVLATCTSFTRHDGEVTGLVSFESNPTVISTCMVCPAVSVPVFGVADVLMPLFALASGEKIGLDKPTRTIAVIVIIETALHRALDTLDEEKYLIWVFLFFSF